MVELTDDILAQMVSITYRLVDHNYIVDIMLCRVILKLDKTDALDFTSEIESIITTGKKDWNNKE